MSARFGLNKGRLLAGAAAGGLLVFAGSAALAEDAPVATAQAEAPVDPREAKIDALEQEVRALASQISELKSEVSSGITDVRKTVAAQPTISLGNGRPTFASADGAFKASLRTVLQFDAAHYSVSPLTTANDLASGTNFRRARIGIDGTAFKVWNYGIWADFGGSGGETPVLNQAWVEYAGWKPFGLKNPVRIRAGAWATPTGLEDATSNTDGLFLERPAVAEMVRNLGGGDGRTGFGVFTNGDRWYASAVLTGAVVGIPTTPEFAEQTSFLGRIALDPIHGSDYDVHIGGNFQDIIEVADTAPGAAVTRQIRLRERPELRVDGTRLVDTNNINADGLRAYGAEAGASFRNLYVAGEYYWIDVNRTGGVGAAAFNPSFSGWYVQGAWTVTGERHPWSAANGGFSGVRPAHVFDPAKGAWGAWEIAGRYSVLDLDASAGVGGATPPGGVRGGVQKITTVGLNWYPNNTIRFLLDYQWVDVNKLSPTGVQSGETSHQLSVRSQVAF